MSGKRVLENAFTDTIKAIEARNGDTRGVPRAN